MSRPLLPVRGDVTDAGFLTLAFLVAVAGFAGTFTGWAFLLVGVVGLGLGIVVGHVANVLRQPLVTVAAMTVGVFFLLGGAVVMRDRAVAGFLPGPDALGGLAESGVDSWKELLTTVPPVDGSGPMLVIPYILGLLCGAGGFTMARRLRWSAAPALAPALVLVAVILLGTHEPDAPRLQGAAFACLVLCWSAVRARRRRRPIRDGGRRATRLATGAGVIAVAAGVAVVASPVLPGAGGDRTVLRDYVTPPFEIDQYPSPLVGFRKYTKDANQLWDQTLFTVRGLPEGGLVRIATLTDYTGTVWGADSGFQRVGPRITTTAQGTPATVTVTIGAAYAASDDVNAWLPTAGVPTGISFDEPGHTDGFRYNLDTLSGIVTDRLSAGDSYTIEAVLPSTQLPEDPQPFGRPTVSTAASTFVNAKATGWAGSETDLGARLRAVASHLRDNGAYSDGGPGEQEYLPGHGTGRLTAFLNAQRPVGDDEQYAAVFALIANQLGMPTRVVLGAQPGPDGVVRGEQVQAWVEVHLADGSWVPLRAADFMPDRSKKPDKQPPQQVENTDASIVPPPNTVHPPSSLTDASQVDPNATRRPGDLDEGSAPWPAFVVFLLTWVLPPLATAALLCLLVLGGKAWRRRRRRTRGTPAARVAAGWQEVLDRARDLGAVIPPGLTRPEQARALGDRAVHPLAHTADATVFGPHDPTDHTATTFWTTVDAVRKAMGSHTSPLHRARAALNLTTFRTRT
ncbi:transglutaminase-like domain-containing protein [Actinokineospora bangkokensis]|uniref:Transglutaminase-like domain-containing protein n=1 Tax=Actinokineospora bangkokensis TaxID=1193682 RepID=A0A1Q9LCR4_9PSEU|nr:transglutaminase-like domain-containing protein [Actinokineospora bangkokensis]OLR89803.1 hypothetical protein BJP25_01915 [Actinokineospora bangkokensis]